MQRILTVDDLRDFARREQLRPDWHEPDESDVTARVEGESFDNAGFWPCDNPSKPRSFEELHVIFSRTTLDADGVTYRAEDLACVNLATLCSWAARP